MKKCLLFLFVVMGGVCVSAAPVNTISLADCEQAAMDFSPELKQKSAEVAAAQAAYDGSGSTLYPSLYFDAQGGWVSEVPKLEVGPLSAQFGDKWSYSVGPTTEYVLFDYGGRKDVSRSAKSAYQAKQNEYEFAKKTVLLDVRRAYFTVQQDLERMYFMSEQLKVAQKQLADIQSAFNAGAKSSIDVYMARKQKLRAQINVSSARGALGAHLRSLFSYTGNNFGIDPSYPVDWRVEVQKGDEKASSVIKADPLTDTLRYLNVHADNDFDENSPTLVALEDMAQYYEHLANSFMSSLYPRIAISGGAYWEYPNGPIKEHTFLGRAGASLRIPLFEGSKSRKEAQSKKSEAQAALYKKQDLEEDLKNLFFSSKSFLYALNVEEKLTKSMIADSAKTAQLTYDAYKAGSVTFLEVDNANLGLLESRIALADLYIERLNRLAVMDNLGTGAL